MRCYGPIHFEASLQRSSLSRLCPGIYTDPETSVSGIAGKAVAEFEEKQQAEFDNIVRGLEAANVALGNRLLFCDGDAIRARGRLLKEDYEGALTGRIENDSSICARLYSQDVLDISRAVTPARLNS